MPAEPNVHSPTSPATSPNSPAISPELRDILAGMARSHDQKAQLAFYEALPWNRTPAPIHAFFSNMAKVQADALKDLTTWAEAKRVSLTYRAGTDLASKGQKIMEARQEKEVRNSSAADFPRITLLQMYTDYEWHVSLIQATLPEVSDPQLKAYLEKSLKIHEAGSAEIMTLLKKYKFTP